MFYIAHPNLPYEPGRAREGVLNGQFSGEYQLNTVDQQPKSPSALLFQYGKRPPKLSF